MLTNSYAIIPIGKGHLLNISIFKYYKNIYKFITYYNNVCSNSLLSKLKNVINYLVKCNNEIILFSAYSGKSYAMNGIIFKYLMMESYITRGTFLFFDLIYFNMYS